MTIGRLSQLAVERLRGRGAKARFIAMRLPYGEQRDEPGAHRAIAFILPDETLAFAIRPAADAMLSPLLSGGTRFSGIAGRILFLAPSKRGNTYSRRRCRESSPRRGGRDWPRR
jgi:hypothetical protein